MFEKVGANSDNANDGTEYDGHEAGDVVVPEGRRAASLASAARAVAKAPDPPPGPMTYHQWLDRELEVFEILRTYSLPLGTFEEYASDEAGRTQSSGTQEQYMFDPWAVQYTAPPRYTSFKQSKGGKRETWQAPRQTFAGICVIDGEMEHVATPPHEVMCSRVREPYDVSQAYSKGYRNIHGIGAVFGLRRGSHTFMSCQHAPQMLPELEGFRVTEDMQGWRLFINARLLPTLPIYWVEFEAQQTDHTRFEQLGARCQLWDVTKICQIVSLPFNMTRLQYLLSHALRIPMNTVAECMQLSMADPKQQAWCDKAYEPLSPETHTPAETMRHAFDYAKTYVRLISMKLDGMMDALGKHQKKNRTRKTVVPTNMDQYGDDDEDDDDDSDSDDDDEELDERGQPHDNMPNAWIKWVRHPETVRYFAQPVLQYLGQFFDMALLLGFGVEQLYELYEIINEQGLALLGTERTIDPDRPASLHPIHRMFFRRTFVHSDHNPWNPGYCDLSTFVSYPHALTRRIRPTSMPELQLMNLFEVADPTLGANPNEYRAAPLAQHLDLQLTITVLVYHVVKESYTRDSHPMMRMADVMARVKQYLNCNTGADMLVLSRTVEKMHLSKYGDSFRPIASICRTLCKLMREQALVEYPHSKNRSGGVIEIMSLKQFIRAVRLALLRLASASGLGRGCIVLEDGTNVTFSLPECDNEEDALMLREEVLSNEALWRKMRVYTTCSWLTQEAIIRGLEKIAKNWKTEQSLVPGGFGAVHPFSMYAWKQRWRAPVFNAMWEAYWCLLVEWEGYKSIHEMEHPEDPSLTEQDQLEFGNDLESFPDVCQDVVMRGGFATPTEAKEVWAGLWEAMVRAGLPEPHELMMELLSRQQQHNQQQGVQFKEFMPCSEQLLAAMATKRSFLTSILGQGGGGKSAATAHILFHSYIPRQVLNARRISVEQRRQQPSYLRKLVVASHSNHAYNFRNTMRRYFDGCQAEGQDYYIGTIHKLLARHRAMCLNRPGLRNCPGTRKALKERWKREEQMGQSPWCHVKAHCKLCCFEWVEEVYLEEVGVSNDPDFQRFVTMLHRCCPNLKRLINMGDFGQLPPIGPGHVARDLPLATGYVPTEHGHSFHELVLMQAGTSVQKGDKKMKWSDGKVMFYHPASRVTIKGWPGLLEARRLNQKHIVDVFLQLFEQRMGTTGTSTPLRLSQCYLNTTTICWTNATRRMAAQLVDGMYLRERASALGELTELWNHLGKNGETMSGTFYPAQKIIVKSNTLKGSTTNQMLVVYDVLEGFVEHTPYQEVARLKDEMYKSLLDQLRVLSSSGPEVPPGIWVDKLINKDHASMFKDLRRWTRDFLSRQKTAQNLEATALQDVSMFAMREVRALMDVSEGRPQSPALGHSFLQYHPDTYARRLLQCEPPERMNLSDTHPTDQCQVLAHSTILAIYFCCIIHFIDTHFLPARGCLYIHVDSFVLAIGAAGCIIPPTCSFEKKSARNDDTPDPHGRT